MNAPYLHDKVEAHGSVRVLVRHRQDVEVREFYVKKVARPAIIVRKRNRRMNCVSSARSTEQLVAKQARRRESPRERASTEEAGAEADVIGGYLP